MSHGDEKNGQNAAQCVAESSCWTTRTNNTYHAAGIELRHLPPYNPDMNPIEMLWSKVRRFCASVNGIASAGLRLMDIVHNFENCYNESYILNHVMGTDLHLYLM